MENDKFNCFFDFLTKLIAFAAYSTNETSHTPAHGVQI